MNHKLSELVIFCLIMFGGWLLEAKWFEKKRQRKRFNLKNYLIFIAGPLLAVSYAMSVSGRAILWMFLLSMIVGSASEYFADRSYASIFGANLWRYYRFNIKGSTSWLILPVWGAAGVAFLLIVRVLIN